MEQALPPDLQRTFVHALFQDHTSALHPTGALALPPLLDAVDVLHVTPHLVVMPDDPRQGEHRQEFATPRPLSRAAPVTAETHETWPRATPWIARRSTPGRCWSAPPACTTIDTGPAT